MRTVATLGIAGGLLAGALTGCGDSGPERFTPPPTESTTSTTINMNLPQATNPQCLAVRALNVAVSSMQTSDRDVLTATEVAEATIRQTQTP